MSGRKVRLVLERREYEYEVETGVPQGSQGTGTVHGIPAGGIRQRARGYRGFHSWAMWHGGRRESQRRKSQGNRTMRQAQRWTGQGKMGSLSTRSRSSCRSDGKAHGSGACRGLQSPIQSTRHLVAWSQDRLQVDPQGAPLRDSVTPNLGVMMADPGLHPAESLLNNVAE